MTLKISTDYYASNEVWSEQVTVEAAKPQLLSATATTPGLVNNVLTGTTLKVNAVVKNEGSNTYENGIELLLCKITWEDPKTGSYGYSYDKTKSVMTTILPGETKEVNCQEKRRKSTSRLRILTLTVSISILSGITRKTWVWS